MKETLLMFLMIVLYFGNYHICEYLYPEDVDMWWTCKGAIYNIIISIGVYLITLKASLVQFFILSVFNGILVNNIVDRLYFKSVGFEWSDIIIIIFIFLLSYIDFIWRRKKKSRRRKY